MRLQFPWTCPPAHLFLNLRCTKKRKYDVTSGIRTRDFAHARQLLFHCAVAHRSSLWRSTVSSLVIVSVHPWKTLAIFSSPSGRMWFYENLHVQKHCAFVTPCVFPFQGHVCRRWCPEIERVVDFWSGLCGPLPGSAIFGTRRALVQLFKRGQYARKRAKNWCFGAKMRKISSLLGG